MISTRRFGFCEDGHGTGEFFSGANLLPVGILVTPERVPVFSNEVTGKRGCV